MYFSSDFETASQDILDKVGQEAVSKYEEKDTKSKCLAFWDIFIINQQVNLNIINNYLFFNN